MPRAVQRRNLSFSEEYCPKDPAATDFVKSRQARPGQAGTFNLNVNSKFKAIFECRLQTVSMMVVIGWSSIELY